MAIAAPTAAFFGAALKSTIAISASAYGHLMNGATAASAPA